MQSLKISLSELQQLPLKGFKTPYKEGATKHAQEIEGMGEGRYRLHAKKTHPRKK